MQRALGALLLTGSLAALADAPAQPRRAPVCAADPDCVISTFVCCLGCSCPPGPYAVSREELERTQSQCNLDDCPTKKCDTRHCATVVPESSLHAYCLAGSCVAQPASVECAADTDCRIVYPAARCVAGPCGCCPGTTPHAVPVRQRLVEEPAPAQPAQKQKGDVKFGLSPGKPSQPAPNCAPCPSPQPATAICSAGRCAVAPVAPRPRPPG